MSTKTLLFSITKKDLRVDKFKAPGKGGQKKNKTESAIRITHKDSGAVGQCSDTRSQSKNKKIAFRRLVDCDKFKKWHKLEVAKRLYGIEKLEKEIKKWVKEQMKPENLKIEMFEPIK